MKKIIGVIIGLIVGFILYGLLYQIVCELLGGYESENFHLFFGSYPLMKPGLWIYSYFIASFIAGYIAGEKGKIVGIITISPIFILTTIALLQSTRTGMIEDVVGVYISIIFLALGLMLAGIFGGDLGENWKTCKLDKFKIQSYLTTFLSVNFLIIILLFHIRFLNLFLTLVIALIIAWFLSSIIITFPPIFSRFNKNKFRPEWFNLLPSHLRPDKKWVIDELEKLRVECGIPHDALNMRILSSPETTRKVQRKMLSEVRKLNLEAPEIELLKMVLISRITSPPSIDMTEQEIDQAMENINSLDDLCDYIIALDEKEPSFPDTFGIGKQIDEILAREEIEKKVSEEK